MQTEQSTTEAPTPFITNNFVPAWLIPLMGEREKAIINHRRAKFLREDLDGNRYPDHQQWIESPVGTMLIDSKKKAIIG